MGLANKLQPSGAPSAPPAQGAGFAQGGQGQFSAGEHGRLCDVMCDKDSEACVLASQKVICLPGLSA